GKKNIEFTMVRESQDGRIITGNTEIKQQPFQITNIYAPPMSKDRVRFFENWTSSIAEERICIITGDFNTNLDPQNDRISSAPSQSDHSRDIIQTLLAEYTNTALFAKESPFLT
ncbi:13836_t:CDS:1, partial [Dentiscutata erythropus]